MSTSHTSWGNDAEQPDEVRTQTYYRELDRPLTRGEIARHLLEPLCRQEESVQQRWRGGEERTAEEIIAAARETYEAIKEVPPVEQAAYFLKQGDQSQKQAAVSFLMENDSEANAPLIEAFLLTSPTDMSDFMGGGYGGFLVAQYVQKRGEQAADFVERYAAMRQQIDLPAGMASDENVVKQLRKRVERELTTLRALVRKPDLSATITALVNTETGDETSVMVAYQTLGRLPAETVVPAMLQAAVQSTNASVRSRILQMMPMLRYAGIQEQTAVEDVAAAIEALAAKNRANIGTNAAAWKILLADTRPDTTAQMGFGHTRDLTLADLAATAIESLYSVDSPIKSFGDHRGAANLPVAVTMRVLRERATARLEGTAEADLPQLPSADDVPDERRAALVAAVTQATAPELPQLLAEFSAAENLYLAEAADEKEPLRKALAAPSRRITSVQIDSTLPEEAAAHLQKLQDTALGTHALAAMRQCCMEQLAGGTAYSVGLTAIGLGRGLSLVVRAVGETGLGGMGNASLFDHLNRKGSQPRGLVTGMLYGGDQDFAHAMWLVELAPATAPAAAAVADAAAADGEKAGQDDAEDDEEDEDDDNGMAEMMMSSFERQNKAFDEAAQTFCAGDRPLAGNASITFTGTLPPSPKDKKSADDDDDDDAMEMMMMGF